MDWGVAYNENDNGRNLYKKHRSGNIIKEQLSQTHKLLISWYRMSLCPPRHKWTGRLKYPT